MARSAFAPTEEQRMTVAIMAACGMPQPLICEKIINGATGAPIDMKTLRKVFRQELDEGGASANAIVAQSLFRKATGNSPQAVTAAIFWLKTRAGWKEPTAAELPGVKLMRQEAAEDVVRQSRFTPGQQPKIVINNR